MFDHVGLTIPIILLSIVALHFYILWGVFKCVSEIKLSPPMIFSEVSRRGHASVGFFQSAS